MSEFDDFLNSLDVNSPENTAQAEEPISQEPERPQAQALSEEDFNNILSDMGFEEAPEEEHDGSDDETSWDDEEEEETYDENIGEGRDLDTEEDADWADRIESGELREADIAIASSQANIERRQVHFHMPNGNVVDVPIVHEAATDLSNANTDEEVAQTIDNHAEDFLIQPNSPTLLMDESTSRFSGTEWYNEIKKQRIILAGCGGIGSWAALQLARMSPESIFLYDDDVVEMANMSGQLYGGEDIGIAKVDAIARTLHAYTTVQNIYALNQRFTSETEAGDIMICGFDNMKARKTFFHSWRKHLRNISDDEKKRCLYLDGRLSIDTLQIFCLTGDDDYNISRYAEDYLFSDEDADATVCSMKQTTYLACMIGSFIVNLFTNHVANLLDPIIPYDLPFFTEYDSQHMIFKTEN